MAHGESGDEQERYRYLDKIDYVVECKQKLGFCSASFRFLLGSARQTFSFPVSAFAKFKQNKY